MARRRKKTVEVYKPRYRQYCHKCRKVVTSEDEIQLNCECGGIAFTVTDHTLLKSSYQVVKK